jgi:hypothetical protein
MIAAAMFFIASAAFSYLFELNKLERFNVAAGSLFGWGLWLTVYGFWRIF